MNLLRSARSPLRGSGLMAPNRIGRQAGRSRAAGLPVLGVPAQRQPVDGQLLAALVELFGGGELVVGDLLVPLGDRDDQLVPGQVHAQAAVRSGAERQVMAELLAAELEGAGGGELPRVVIGAAQAQPDDVALRSE